MNEFGLIVTVVRHNMQWSHTVQLGMAPFGMSLGGYQVLDIEKPRRPPLRLPPTTSWG